MMKVKRRIMKPSLLTIINAARRWLNTAVAAGLTFVGMAIVLPRFSSGGRIPVDFFHDAVICLSFVPPLVAILIVAPGRYSYARIAALAAIVIGSAIFLYVYPPMAAAAYNRDIARYADGDWADQNAVIYSVTGESTRRVNGIDIHSLFDPDSGLPINSPTRQAIESFIRSASYSRGVLSQGWPNRDDFAAAYDAEIRRLLQSRGIPPWSVKYRFPADADLIGMFTATEMTEVPSFPHLITAGIIIHFEKPSFRPAAAPPYFFLESTRQNMPVFGPLGKQDDTVFIGELRKYPDLIFVRCGESVVVCTTDGLLLECAMAQ